MTELWDDLLTCLDPHALFPREGTADEPVWYEVSRQADAGMQMRVDTGGYLKWYDFHQ